MVGVQLLSHRSSTDVAVKDRELSYGEADRQVGDLPRISVAKPYRTQLNESFEIRAIFPRNLSPFPRFIYIEER